MKAAFLGSDHRDNPMIPELGGYSPEATVAKEALPTPFWAPTSSFVTCGGWESLLRPCWFQLLCRSYKKVKRELCLPLFHSHPR